MGFRIKKPGFGPAVEVLLFRQKDPKPLTPRPASLDGTDAGYEERANSLRSDKARRMLKSVRPDGRTAGVSSQRGRHPDKKALEFIWENKLKKG